MIQPYFNSLISKRVVQNRYDKYAAALEAFSIANAIFWVGNIIYTINNEESLIDLSLIDLDLGIILMYSGFVQILDHSEMLTFAVIGWIVAGIRLKKKYYKEATNILFLSILIPISLFPILFLIIIMNFLFSVFAPILISLIIPIILLIILVNTVGLLVVIPGLIVAEFIKEPNSLEPSVRVSNNSLMLSGSVPPQPNEPVHFCIYRMRDKQGCAFLGYEVGNYPLICDYQSTWRACRLYSHLYYKLVVLENEK